MNEKKSRHFLKWGMYSIRMLPVVLWSCPASANQGAGGGSISTLNILFLGLMAYFLVRAFRRRSGGDNDRKDQWGQGKHGDSPETKNPPQGSTIDRHDVARQMWEMLGSQPEDNRESPAAQVVSGGFDEAEFLEGAKLFFSRFQQVGDREELDQLHGFLSETVYREALDRMQTGESEKTEVMLVDARLLEMKTEGGRTAVSVRYDAQLRRGESGERAENLSAVWEFSRDDGDSNGLWTLETINPMNQ